MFLELTVEVAIQQHGLGQGAAAVLGIFADQNVMRNGRAFAAVGGDDPDHAGFVHLHETGA